jgi:hypothetical protein
VESAQELDHGKNVLLNLEPEQWKKKKKKKKKTE